MGHQMLDHIKCSRYWVPFTTDTALTRKLLGMVTVNVQSYCLSATPENYPQLSRRLLAQGIGAFLKPLAKD